jgi:hypothetical protein
MFQAFFSNPRDTEDKVGRRVMIRKKMQVKERDYLLVFPGLLTTEEEEVLISI